MIITIGFTKADRMWELYGVRNADTYVPAIDGWRAGAEQDTVTIEVADLELSPELWAQAVWTATSAPDEVDLSQYAGAAEAAEALTAVGPLPRAVDVGDTVDVDGRTWVCEKRGWTFLTLEEAAA